MPAESKHHTEVNGSGFMLAKSAGTQKKSELLNFKQLLLTAVHLMSCWFELMH